MKLFVCLLVLSGAFLLCHSPAHSQPAISGSLDELIDWNNPSSLTPDKFRKMAEAIPHKQSARTYEVNSRGTQVVMAMGGYYSTTDTKLSLFGGQLRVEGVQATFEGTALTNLQFCVGQAGPSTVIGKDRSTVKSVSKAEVALLKSELSKRTGDAMPRPQAAEPGKQITVWSHSGYTAQAVETVLGRSGGGAQKRIDVVLVYIRLSAR